jgi:cholesterol transport system auxiliary component
MNKGHNAYRLTMCILALSSGACALTSRSEPLTIRYYTLDTGATEPIAPPNQQPIELRIGRVDASDYLREEIAYRDSQHELSFYDSERWTEKPQEFLRRALARTLYQERGFTRVFSGSAPTLDVELVEFEELRGPQPKVRLQAIAILHDERRSQFEQTITVERPIANASSPDHTDATAAALAAALQSAVSTVADRVIASLASGPSVANEQTAPPAPTADAGLHR